MIVVDSSALIKYFSRESDWRRVRKVLLSEPRVFSIKLAVKEAANALWRKVLREELDEKTALEILSDLASGKPIVLEKQGQKLLGEALLIAVRRKITIYDALFIALAKRLKARLLTSDQKQAEATGKEGVDILLV